MKKRLILAVFLAAVLTLFSACVVNETTGSAEPSGESAPPASHSVGESPADTAETAPSAAEERTPQPPGGPREESSAYITAMSERADGQTDITFDYVDWLSGDEARAAYLEDHPGATEQEMEDAGLFEIGYIRNVNPQLRTYPTGEDTEYYLPDPADIATNVPVSHEAFLGRTAPAVDEGVDSYLTFVRVRVSGGVVASIEWLYLP